MKKSSIPLQGDGARRSSRLSPSRAALVLCLAGAALAFALLAGPDALAQSSIRVLVNDDAITTFDIKQRTQMLRIFTRNQQGEKEATEQLIDERLMLQEAERRGVSATEEEIEQEVAKRARAANLSTAQFQQAMRQAGFDPRTFRDFIHANMLWQQIIRARFRAEEQVTDQDVAAALTQRPEADAAATEAGDVQTVYEYRLQPIIFVVPAGAAPAVEKQRQNEAAAFRIDFAGCDAALQQVGGTPGVVVKPQVRREEGQMNPALKKALAGLDVGGITEPERVNDGIQLLGVCAKQEIAGQTAATVEIREELSDERGKLLARRYLRDLRSDAAIEYPLSSAGTAKPLVLTLGEPAGIGPDIAVEAWFRRRTAHIPVFVFAGDPALLQRRAAALGRELATQTMRPADAAQAFPDVLPCLPGSAAVSGAPGRINPADTPAVIGSIRTAVESVRAGEAAALVTNPINKKALNAAGFAFPGHTEFLAALSAELFATPATPVMMLAGPGLRVVPVTIHIPLADVPRALTADRIVETGRIVAHELKRRFGIVRPRLAVAGLNPHAGEEGMLGGEDETIVRPAVEQLNADGIDAFGPLSADTMFHPAARETYDAALCMYHDQALIPLKTLAFDEGVNVTLGLPFIRTSPDHGTALPLAGTGRARATSLIEALRLADALARNERQA